MPKNQEINSTTKYISCRFQK